MWSSLSSTHKWTMAGLGIAGVIGIVKGVQEYHEKQIQLAQENAKAYTDSADSIANYYLI